MTEKTRVIKGAEFFNSGIPIRVFRKLIAEPIAMHTHDFLEFYFVVSGVGEQVIGNKRYPIRKGDLVVLNYLEKHSFVRSSKGMNAEVITCCFLPSLIQPSLKNLSQVKGFVDLFFLEPFFREETNFSQKLNLIGEDEFEIRMLMEKMVKEYDQKKTGHELVLKSLLTECLVRLARVYHRYEEKKNFSGEMDTRKTLILGALKYIDQHVEQEIRLDEVASICYVTSNYFCSLFKKVTGKTLFQYVNEQRIRRACELLKGSDDKLSNIARQAGFSYLPYFNRTFKKITGKTPGRWRGQPA